MNVVMTETDAMEPHDTLLILSFSYLVGEADEDVCVCVIRGALYTANSKF